MTQARSDRRRVVYIDHVARWSGGEIALARLLKALDGQVDAHVILGEDGALVPALRSIGGVTVEVLPMATALRDTRRHEVTPRRLPLRQAAYLGRYVWQLRRRLRELRPDLVHTNSLKAALYGGFAARLAGVPVLWHVRDRIADDYLPRPAVRLVRLAANWIPHAVVANSRSTLETLPGGLRSTVLYNPVIDNSDVRPPLMSRQPGPLRVGVVGRLAEWKGQHVFLEAFAKAFPAGGEEAWLIGSAVFGETEYELSLRQLADALGIAERVRWRGFREDVMSELRQLDILVHCSISPEPFGSVIVEAMAAGLPVVAAAAGGPLEIVDDGKDGLLVPPADAEELARALSSLADSEETRRRLGHAAMESSRRFGPEAAVKTTLAVYDAISRPRP